MAGHQRTADTPAGGGRADTPAGGGQVDTGGGRYTTDGHTYRYMLTLLGKGGYGGSPNVEAGKGVSTRPWPLAKGKNFILVSECLPGFMFYLSSRTRNFL
jgi:hypothetical protein